MEPQIIFLLERLSGLQCLGCCPPGVSWEAARENWLEWPGWRYTFCILNSKKGKHLIPSIGVDGTALLNSARRRISCSMEWCFYTGRGALKGCAWWSRWEECEEEAQTSFWVALQVDFYYMWFWCGARPHYPGSVIILADGWVVKLLLLPMSKHTVLVTPKAAFTNALFLYLK